MDDNEKRDKTAQLEDILAIATSFLLKLGIPHRRVRLKPLTQTAYPRVEVELELPNGTVIEFVAEMDGWRNEGRISFEQYLDRTLVDHVPYNATRHEITVAKGKEPYKIAGDLARRFLPDYIDFYVDLLQKREQTREYRRQVDENADRLARSAVHVTRTTARGEDDGHTREISLRGAGEGRAYGDGQVYRDSVNLKLHNLSLTEAEHILKYLSSGEGRLFDRPV